MKDNFRWQLQLAEPAPAGLAIQILFFSLFVGQKKPIPAGESLKKHVVLNESHLGDAPSLLFLSYKSLLSKNMYSLQSSRLPSLQVSKASSFQISKPPSSQLLIRRLSNMESFLCSHKYILLAFLRFARAFRSGRRWAFFSLPLSIRTQIQ